MLSKTLRFNPCESIADAWKVVEWMNGEGYGFCLEHFASPERWECLFDIGLQGYCSEAESAPMAIVNAALKTMEGNETK